MGHLGARRIPVPGTRFEIRWVSETGSTNDDLLVEAERGAPEGLALAADVQTAGRGRLGRRWESPRGASLLISVLLRPGVHVSHGFALVAASALAMRGAVREVCEVEVDVKWPNDLVVRASRGGGWRKLGGILAESVTADERLDALVVGTGVNCNWQGFVPDELADVAISLDALCGGEVDRELLAVTYLTELERLLIRAAQTDLGEVTKSWKEASVTIGRDVVVDLGAGRSIRGVAEDVDDLGRLRVRSDDGVLHEVAVGDVVHLR
ncbi:MAG: biotin--[acetyl-CoA-carboxylase] ligase [Acidimicrobiales bacterium]|nr:MAG: biotin--[acetyl-CoA-carboxylase] ligase [Acidimicrobiales bacterium]